MVYVIILMLAIICLFATYVIFNKNENRKSKTIIDITRAILIILILELSIFNMNSYRLIFGNFENVRYAVQNLNLEDGLEQKDGKYITTKEITKKIELDDINKEVGTVKLNIDTNRPIEYKIYYTDTTSQPRATCPLGVCRVRLSERTLVSTTVLATETAMPKTAPDGQDQPKKCVASIPSPVAAAIWIMAPGSAIF